MALASLATAEAGQTLRAWASMVWAAWQGQVRRLLRLPGPRAMPVAAAWRVVGTLPAWREQVCLRRFRSPGCRLWGATGSAGGEG